MIAMREISWIMWKLLPKEGPNVKSTALRNAIDLTTATAHRICVNTNCKQWNGCQTQAQYLWLVTLGGTNSVRFSSYLRSQIIQHLLSICRVSESIVQLQLPRNCMKSTERTSNWRSFEISHLKSKVERPSKQHSSSIHFQRWSTWQRIS